MHRCVLSSFKLKIVYTERSMWLCHVVMCGCVALSTLLSFMPCRKAVATACLRHILNRTCIQKDCTRYKVKKKKEDNWLIFSLFLRFTVSKHVSSYRIQDTNVAYMLTEAFCGDISYRFLTAVTNYIFIYCPKVYITQYTITKNTNKRSVLKISECFNIFACNCLMLNQHSVTLVNS